MKIQALVQAVVGALCIFLSLYVPIFVFDNSDSGGSILHGPSMWLVVGALVGISLFLVQANDYLRFVTFLFGYSVAKAKDRLQKSEQSFEKMLDVYSSEGMEALRRYVTASDFPKIWEIVATKLEIQMPIADIRTILRFQIRRTVTRIDQDLVNLRQLSSLAPSVGMFGSVLGLIRLLANMKDFSSLGSNMSLALVTTLYGIFISNFILVPIIRRVETRKYLAMKNHENIMYWIDNVAENKPSFYLKRRLGEIARVEQDPD